MRQPTDDDLLPEPPPSNDWGVAVTIAVAIVICVTAFLLIFFELEPFMSDFTGSNSTPTSEIVEPIGSPSPSR